MSARDDILSRLRGSLVRPDLRFPPAQTSLLDLDRMTVTEASGNAYELAYRFGQELTELHGTFEVVESVAEARLTLLNRLGVWMDQEEKAQKGAVVQTGQERSILSWSPEMLPVDGLAVALEDMHLLLVAPEDLQSDEARENIRFVRYGITGVDAAFASTGSMFMISGPGKSRAASLLPYYHIGLVPFSRLYPTIESWIAEQREAGKLADLFRDPANVMMITGPSKSADIEMNLTLGVHGPRHVHAILFDDDSAGFAFEAESEFDNLRFDNQFGFEEA